MFRRRVLPSLLLSLGLLAAEAGAQGPGAARYGGSRATCAPTTAVWVPGHHERVGVRRWVPGGTRREWIPARTRRVCSLWGAVREVVVSPGRWVLVPVPGRYETCWEEVWVPGAWTHVPR
ncbi:MAG TPA: hypothetical protein VMT18_14745 [Planctomycetota bacterium]|nr:hypothetical protein [Planctomycetota bacterium]